MTKNNEVIAENPSQKSGVTHQELGRLELTLVVNTAIILIIISFLK